MDKLKPCPFCGYIAKIEKIKHKLPKFLSKIDGKPMGDDKYRTNFIVKCQYCRAQTEEQWFEEQAIEAWNRRADGGNNEH